MYNVSYKAQQQQQKQTNKQQHLLCTIKKIQNSKLYLDSKKSRNTLHTFEKHNPEEFAANSKQMTAVAVLLKLSEARLDPHRTSTIR